MPKPLVDLTVAAPSFYGLNKQVSSALLSPEWATEAVNCILDDSGRIASRKGFTYLNTTAITSTPDVLQVHEYIDTGGGTELLCAAGNAIYLRSGTSLTDVSGTITTPSDDNWKFLNFNGNCVGFMYGQAAPIVKTATGGGNVFADITTTGTDQPGAAVADALAAFGRIWVLEGHYLKYSDALDYTAYNGSFDLSTVWLNGMDEGVALAEWNGYLVVFGKKSIVVYQNPWVPTSGGTLNLGNMTLVENIGGTGCISRDSVQTTGKDILFLSQNGLRSLGRTIQEKSMPITDVSKNNHDYLLSYVASENTDYIKSTYNPKEGFYLLNMPVSNKVFCFDLRMPLQDGSLRMTEWDIDITSCTTSLAGTTYFGNAGYIAAHTGYLDGIAQGGSGGSTYELSYHSGWLTMGEDLKGVLKIPKNINTLVYAQTATTITAKWAFDYDDTFSSRNITLNNTGTLTEFGIAEYSGDVIGIPFPAEYGGGGAYTQARTPMDSSGEVIKFGINSIINGTNIAIQRFHVVAKLGRMVA